MKFRSVAPSLLLLLVSSFSWAHARDRVQDLVDEQKFQTAIWYAQYTGQIERAETLTQELENNLVSGPHEEISLLGIDGDASKFIFKYANGVRGLFKPDLRFAPLQILDPGDPVYLAALKNSEYAFSNSQSEVATYRLSQLFKHMNIVPVTTVVEISGILGSMQTMVEDAVHSDFRDHAGHTKRRVFDFIIMNTDRREPNWMSVDLDVDVPHMIAIDNGAAFDRAPGNSGRYPGDAVVLRLEPELQDEIKAVTDEEVTATLRGLVQPSRIQPLLERLHQVKNVLFRANRGANDLHSLR